MKLLTAKNSSISALLVIAAWIPVACSDVKNNDPGAKVETHHDFEPNQTTTVSTLIQPIWYEAVGTVAPAVTINVAPQVNGRILEMLVEVGQEVTAGTILFRIDDRTIRTQVVQAQAMLSSASAAAEQSAARKARVYRLFAREAATPEQVETANAADAQAQAAVTTAKQALLAAQTYLSYSKVRSPVDGVIAERLARAGDLALPGKPVLQIHSGLQMDFVAAIGESKIEGIHIGSEFQVDFPTLALRLPAVVHEMNPAADPNTRSFTIKASLPSIELLRSGMYGKLMLQTGEREVTVIPQNALNRVGQLETVMVQTEGTWLRRFVRSGRKLEGDYFEILAGLSDGEIIGWIK